MTWHEAISQQLNVDDRPQATLAELVGTNVPNLRRYVKTGGGIGPAVVEKLATTLGLQLAMPGSGVVKEVIVEVVREVMVPAEVTVTSQPDSEARCCQCGLVVSPTTPGTQLAVRRIPPPPPRPGMPGGPNCQERARSQRDLWKMGFIPKPTG